jgi:hypothetical protein
MKQATAQGRTESAPPPSAATSLASTSVSPLLLFPCGLLRSVLAVPKKPFAPPPGSQWLAGGRAAEQNRAAAGTRRTPHDTNSHTQKEDAADGLICGLPRRRAPSVRRAQIPAAAGPTPAHQPASAAPVACSTLRAAHRMRRQGGTAPSTLLRSASTSASGLPSRAALSRKTALVFPGQGSQRVGASVRALEEAWPNIVRPVWQELDETVKANISRTMKEGLMVRHHFRAVYAPRRGPNERP